MSGAQNAVLWMGILLIVVRLLTTGQWGDVWGTLKSGTPAASTGTGSTSPSAAPSGSAPQVQRNANGTVKQMAG